MDEQFTRFGIDDPKLFHAMPVVDALFIFEIQPTGLGRQNFDYEVRCAFTAGIRQQPEVCLEDHDNVVLENIRFREVYVEWSVIENA